MKRGICFVAALALLWALGTAAPLRAHDSLYKRLGGYDAIAAVVDDFIGRMASDPQLSRFFVGHSTQSLQTGIRMASSHWLRPDLSGTGRAAFRPALRIMRL